MTNGFTEKTCDLYTYKFSRNRVSAVYRQTKLRTQGISTLMTLVENPENLFLYIVMTAARSEDWQITWYYVLYTECTQTVFYQFFFEYKLHSNKYVQFIKSETFKFVYCILTKNTSKISKIPNLDISIHRWSKLFCIIWVSFVLNDTMAPLYALYRLAYFHVIIPLAPIVTPSIAIRTISPGIYHFMPLVMSD